MEQNDFMAAMQQEAPKKGANEIALELAKSDSFAVEGVSNGVAKFTLIFGIIICVVLFIVGIVVGLDKATGWIYVGIGLLLFVCNLITWSLIKMITNISYRLTSIDNKLAAK